MSAFALRKSSSARAEGSSGAAHALTGALASTTKAVSQSLVFIDQWRSAVARSTSGSCALDAAGAAVAGATLARVVTMRGGLGIGCTDDVCAGASATDAGGAADDGVVRTTAVAGGCGVTSTASVGRCAVAPRCDAAIVPATR